MQLLLKFKQDSRHDQIMTNILANATGEWRLMLKSEISTATTTREREKEREREREQGCEQMTNSKKGCEQ